MNLTIKNTNSTLRETFWTDATGEDILWIIKIHDGNEDMIRKWDREKILSNIGWVSYHLRRAGFKILEKQKGENIYVINVNEINIYKL